MGHSDASAADNGTKFAAVDATPATGGMPRRVRAVGERSPTSAALVERYSLLDDADPSAAMAASVRADGIPAIPRGPGVNIGPGGAHVLSEGYTGYLSRSMRVMAEG
ncbi:hypothetical protein IWQ56_001239, partial [Coemansia nantahalensis]